MPGRNVRINQLQDDSNYGQDPNRDMSQKEQDRKKVERWIGKAWDELEKVAKESPKTKVTEKADQREKQEILDQCNYGFNVMKSSVVVGLTMKSLDYMCAGLPIINTIQGDTKNFCEEWNIGFNINKGNIKEIANQVCLESMDVQLQRRKNIQTLYNTYFTKKRFYEVLDKTLDL